MNCNYPASGIQSSTLAHSHSPERSVVTVCNITQEIRERSRTEAKNVLLLFMPKGKTETMQYATELNWVYCILIILLIFQARMPNSSAFQMWGFVVVFFCFFFFFTLHYNNNLLVLMNVSVITYHLPSKKLLQFQLTAGELQFQSFKVDSETESSHVTLITK